jgi:hypothetical protein
MRGHQPHEPLQDTEIVKHAEKRRDKNDRRQGAECEDKGILLSEYLFHGSEVGKRAEDELGPSIGCSNEVLDSLADGFDRIPGPRHSQPAGNPMKPNRLDHHDRQDELEADAPEQRLETHRLQAARRQGGEPEKANESGSGLASHSDLSLESIRRQSDRRDADCNGGPPPRPKLCLPCRHIPYWGVQVHGFQFLKEALEESRITFRFVAVGFTTYLFPLRSRGGFQPFSGWREGTK